VNPYITKPILSGLLLECFTLVLESSICNKNVLSTLNSIKYKRTHLFYKWAFVGIRCPDTGLKFVEPERPF
jgi:hypothetical protein